MTPSKILRSLLAISLAVLASCGGGDEEVFVQPDILLISAGDLAVEDLGTYGGPIPTPNLDRLAAQGIVFDRAYAAAAQPGPSRAALASGRYPQRFGYHFDTGGVRKTISEKTGIPNEVLLLPERLKTLGYRTALYGSWHLGSVPIFYPMFHGYDSFWGTLGSQTAYTEPRRKDAVFARTRNYRLPPSRSLFDAVIAGRQADTVNNTRNYLTDDMGDEIVKYLRRYDDEEKSAEQTQDTQTAPPFFLWAAFHAPREPLTALKADMVGFETLGSKERQIYAAMITALDRNIGKILDALVARGRLDNTIIVFTADRGCDAMARTCPCSTLRGGAPSFREAGLRVPLIISYPAKFPPKTNVYGPVMGIDIAPTIIAHADPKPRLMPELDGLNLSNAMLGNEAPLIRRTLFWDQFPFSAVISGNRKVLLDGTSNQAKMYNLENDPSENQDIARGDIYTVSELETKLDVWQQANPFPAWEGYKSKSMQICGTTEHVLQ